MLFRTTFEEHQNRRWGPWEFGNEGRIPLRQQRNIWVFPKIGVSPKWMVYKFIMENPIKIGTHSFGGMKLHAKIYALRIQTPPDRIGWRVPFPSGRNRKVGIIPFLGHTWSLRDRNAQEKLGCFSWFFSEMHKNWMLIGTYTNLGIDLLNLCNSLESYAIKDVNFMGSWGCSSHKVWILWREWWCAKGW